MVLALTVLLGAVRLRLFGETGLALLGGAAVMAAFTTGLLIDARTKKPPARETTKRRRADFGE